MQSIRTITPLAKMYCDMTSIFFTLLPVRHIKSSGLGVTEALLVNFSLSKIFDLENSISVYYRSLTDLSFLHKSTCNKNNI